MGLRRVKRGDKLRRSTGTAAAWNKFIDAVEWIEKFQQKSGESQREYRDGIVQCTGASVFEQFNVVGIETILYGPDDNLPEFKNNYAFQAVIPTVEHRHKFGILQEPLSTGQPVSPVKVAGTSVCKLIVNDERHKFARIVPGNYVELETVQSGGVPILWREDAGSSRWAVVLLDRSSSPSSTVIASLCGDLCFDAEVTLIANTAYDPETGEDVDMTGMDLINPRHHTGRHEDEVELRWDQRRLAYYVLDIERHWIRPLTRIQKHGTDSKGCFTITGPKISVESCEGDLPSEACLLFDWKPCPTGSGTEEDYDCPLTAAPTDIDICDNETLSSSYDCSSGGE